MNPKDRVQMGSYRFIFAAVGILILSFCTSGLLEYFGGGQKGWTAVSIIYSIICLVLLLVPPSFDVRTGTNGSATAAGRIPAKLSVPSRDAFPS